MSPMLFFDPRTKLLAVLLSCTLAFLIGDGGLLMLAAAMAVYLWLQGLGGRAAHYLVGFAVLYGVQYVIYHHLPGAAIILGFMAYFGARLVPVAMASAALASTPPGELIAALQKLRIPKAVIVPLAVGLRFMPCIAREVATIRDAMRLRGISLFSARGLRNPLLVVECAYVPLLMRSLRLSDELAASAAARGIDNPGPRTCARSVQIRPVDVAALAALLVLSGAIVAYHG